MSAAAGGEWPRGASGRISRLKKETGGAYCRGEGLRAWSGSGERAVRGRVREAGRSGRCGDRPDRVCAVWAD